MKKNGEYVGVDEKFIPEDEKYVDESLLGDRKETERVVKKVIKYRSIAIIIFIGFIFLLMIGASIFMFFFFGLMKNEYTNQVNQIKDNYNEKSNQMIDDFNEIKNNILDNYNRMSNSIK